MSRKKQEKPSRRISIERWVQEDTKALTFVLMERMEKRRMTRGALAELAGLGIGTIDRLATYQTRLPQVRTIMKIAKVLGKKLDLVDARKQYAQATR